MAKEPSMGEIIRRRTSIRSYDKEPLGGEVRYELEEILARAAAPMGTPCRFALVDSDAFDGGINALGTYGMIKGARTFIVGSVTEGDLDLEGFGYAMERIILDATALDLGTCWVGGVFNRSGFGDKIGASDDELVPAVSPVGTPKAKRGLVDRVIRWGAGSTKRKPPEELFFRESLTTPLSAPEEPLATMLELVRLGPSASNKQPWRLVVQDGGARVHLLLARSPGYRALIKAVDLQRLDMGIAMCHFDLAAREAGLEGRWERIDHGLGDLPEGTEYSMTWTRLG